MATTFTTEDGIAAVGGRRAGGGWMCARLLRSWLPRRRAGPGARVAQVTYCTARVDAVTNPSAHVDQDVYLKALLATGSVDWIEYGNYVARTKAALVALDDPQTRRPVIQTSGWPLMIQDSSGADVPGARFMVRYLHLEEKGSDVNVASHLLLDVLSGMSMRQSLFPMTVTLPSQSRRPGTAFRWAW